MAIRTGYYDDSSNNIARALGFRDYATMRARAKLVCGQRNPDWGDARLFVARTPHGNAVAWQERGDHLQMGAREYPTLREALAAQSERCQQLPKDRQWPWIIG